MSDIEKKKKMKNLDSLKLPEESDIPTKVIRNNIDIFAPILYQEFSKCNRKISIRNEISKSNKER